MAGSAFIEAAQSVSLFYHQNTNGSERQHWLNMAQELGRHCTSSHHSPADIANTLDHCGTPLREAFTQGVLGLIDRETEFSEKLRELRLFVARERETGPKLVVDNTL